MKKLQFDFFELMIWKKSLILPNLNNHDNCFTTMIIGFKPYLEKRYGNS